MDVLQSLLGETAPEPRPLLFPPGAIGLIWSAKSACTTAVLWFFANAGLLEASVGYHSWPHRYRIRELPKSDMYNRWLADGDPHAIRWVRVIRDPYARAVSSYRHALRHRYADAVIERVLDLRASERGFSFAEYLEFLRRIDIAVCDVHYRRQWHPLEQEASQVRIVNADRVPLLDALCRIAEPDPAAAALMHREIARIASFHRAQRVTVDDDCSQTVFRPAAAAGSWPDYRAFLNAATRASIAEIYAKDFEAYADEL